MNFTSVRDFSMGIQHKGSTRSLHLGFLSSLLALTSSCMPSNHEMTTLASADSNNALVDRTIESEKPVDVKLDSIKDDPIGKTIVYQAFERSEKANREVQYDPNENDHPNTIQMEGSPSTVTLVIKFPQLSLEQFNFLKNHYGQGASKVIFKPGEIYTLPDFFQPPIHALHSKYHYTRIGVNSHLKLAKS